MTGLDFPHLESIFLKGGRVNHFRDLYHASPDLRKYCESLWGNFAPPEYFDLLAERCSPLLGTGLESELARWRSRGWLPEPDSTDDSWVGDLWQSPLFQGLMGVIGFYPDSDADIRPSLASPVASEAEFRQRRVEFLDHYKSGRVARGESLYWQMVLKYQAPELYLHPYLPTESQLCGCDLACGWGRISLGLRDYSRLRVVACDLAQPSLRLLRRMAQQLNLSQQVVPIRVDIFNLPWGEESVDFFLAFDIFEHLAIPSVIRLLYDLLEKGKVGAVLYAEIPLFAYCPALSHLRNWGAKDVVEIFEGSQWAGKSWKLLRHDPGAEEHFAFQIVKV